MTWAVERRLDYIDWVLARRGFVFRSDLVLQFGVSLNQATHDLGDFLDAHPDAMAYDARARRYTAAEPYRSRRGLGRRVMAAIDALAATGHPMAWRLAE